MRSKLLQVGVGAVIIGGLFLIVYRPSYLRVDGTGITSNSGGKVVIQWSEVEAAIYVPDLTATKYRPTERIKGVAFGPYRTGTFQTEGAGTVRLVSQQTRGALVIRTGSRLYEFSPDHLDRMVPEVARYISVDGWPPKQ